VSEDLRVTFSGKTSYEEATGGLLVTPGPDSGLLYGNVGNGMGTDAIGPVLSIQSGTPNESMVFQIFRTNGTNLGAAEGAINMTLQVSGLPGTIVFALSAEDKDGTALGTATATTGGSPINVSALISGEIHKLTVEATSGPVTPFFLDYTHVCLGYTPAP